MAVREEQRETTEQIVARTAREHASEKAKIHGLDVRAIEQQEMFEEEEHKKEEAMAKAKGGYGLRPRGRPALPEGVKGARRTRAEMEEARLMGMEDKPKAPRGRPAGPPRTVEDVREMAVREQVPLTAFVQLPGLQAEGGAPRIRLTGRKLVGGKLVGPDE